MPDFHGTQRDETILTVTIERPDRMNALHPPANCELEKTIDEFAAGPEFTQASQARSEA